VWTTLRVAIRPREHLMRTEEHSPEPAHISMRPKNLPPQLARPDEQQRALPGSTYNADPSLARCPEPTVLVPVYDAVARRWEVRASISRPTPRTIPIQGAVLHQ